MEGAAIIIVIVVVVIILAIVATVYSVQAIFLNKLNKELFGKGTALAWIPVCNVYLIGKLAVNKTVGWILVGSVFLCTEFTTTVNGVEKSYSLIPGGSGLVSLAELVLFVLAMVKLSKLKKGVLNPDIERAKCDTFSFKPDLSNVAAQGVVNQTVVQQEPQIVSQQPVIQPMAPQEPQIVSQEPQIISQQPVEQVQQTRYCPACGNALIPNNPTCPTCGRQE